LVVLGEERGVLLAKEWRGKGMGEGMAVSAAVLLKD
jgi:hypothetical protein